MPERVILFDLGNVVLDWSPVRLYRQIFQSDEAARRFCAEVCTMDWHTDHDRGVPMAENARRLKAVYPHHADEIDAWRERWFDMFDGYVDGTDEIIARLDAQGHPLFGLSNMPAEVWSETRRRFPVLERLRDVVVSGEEGCVKPDPRIFEITLQRLGGREAQDIFFIDDSARNVEAARQLGFQTHHFQSADGLERALRHEGIL